MRSRILISSLAATGLLVLGSVAPAYAAQSSVEDEGSTVAAETQEMQDHAGIPGMAKLHEQMKMGTIDMADMPDMADMTDMTKMGPMMKAHHANPRATDKQR